MPGIIVRVDVEVDHLIIVERAANSVCSASGDKQEVASRPLRHAARDEEAGASIIGHAIHPSSRAGYAGPHGQAERCAIIGKRFGVNLPKVVRDSAAAVSDGDCNAVGPLLRVAMSGHETPS